MSISTKTCTRCNQEKELINFKKNPQAKSGYSCFCLECFKINKKEVDRRHRNENRERILKRQKERRLENIEKYKERESRYRIKNRLNPEWINRNYNQGKIYRERNKERIQQEKREYYIKNKNIILAKEKIKRQAPEYKKYMREYLMDYYKKNRVYLKEANRRKRLLNLDINKERGRSRRDRKELRDGYVKQALLWDSTILKAKDIPAEIVELYRLNLTLKRLKREKCLC